MNKILRTFPPSFPSVRHKQGFTLIELIIAIAIVAILSVIALPSMSDFLVKMRVDNQITEMQRLLLTARNMAINTGKNTTVCPLSGGACTNNWHNEITVFTNGDNDYDEYKAPSDEFVKVKEAIKSGDKLQFPHTSLIYKPSGQLLTPTIASTFKYCPKDQADRSRGIDVSISGRSYISSDTDNDGKDEDRSSNEIVCSS
ncbi:MAG: type IV fimbrial biogenesis protein FimT [Psychromonas sp.]|jgi:type IV fimbrial biogenesis protein FimT|uniref:GspH/FimT family pseudopilin n=1 Tax=Psychromonas sp. TaxID=1884585 RepID=UPI0039E44D4F|tara:strand:+ start:8610 stop:9209 length:600 start_codon:yes stop_codon:yes gene_type:complete